MEMCVKCIRAQYKPCVWWMWLESGQSLLNYSVFCDFTGRWGRQGAGRRRVYSAWKVCVCVCVCVCVWARYCYLFRTFSSPGLVRTSGPHEDQSLVLMRQIIGCEVLVTFRVRQELVMVEVKDKVLIRLSNINSNNYIYTAHFKREVSKCFSNILILIMIS